MKNSLVHFRQLVISIVSIIIVLNLFSIHNVRHNGMEPDLYAGDHVFVSRLSYGFRFAFTPIKWPWSDPAWYSRIVQLPHLRIGYKPAEVGDLIYFNQPARDNTPIDLRETMVSRVYDRPLKSGDTVWVDELIEKPQLYATIDQYENQEIELIDHELFDRGILTEYIVVENDYYDVRMNGEMEWFDSRHFGWVPSTHLIGEVKFVPWSITPEGIQWKRIFAIP